MKQMRGLTLVELMTSLTIMLVAVAATCAMLVEAMHLTRNTEEIAESNDASRLAAGTLNNLARIAGMASGAGVYVNVGGVATRINPIFGLDNRTGPDELWMVIPATKNVLRYGCGASPVSGAGVPVTAVNSDRSLSVLCTGGFTPGQMLLVSTMVPGGMSSALITGTSWIGNTISYAEQAVPAFSNRGPSGFQPNDLVFPADVVHFYVGPNGNGTQSLFRCSCVLGAGPGGIPFVDRPGPGSCMQLHSPIEDFQVVYGFDLGQTGDPASYRQLPGLLPTAYQDGLRYLRVNVVATSRRKAIAADGRVHQGHAPLSVENHIVVGGSDGFRRSLYTRRIELPNLAPGNL